MRIHSMYFSEFQSCVIWEYNNALNAEKSAVYFFVKGVVHCVQTAGHISTQKAPRTLQRLKLQTTGVQLKPETYIDKSGL